MSRHPISVTLTAISLYFICAIFSLAFSRSQISYSVMQNNATRTHNQCNCCGSCKYTYVFSYTAFIHSSLPSSLVPLSSFHRVPLTLTTSNYLHTLSFFWFAVLWCRYAAPSLIRHPSSLPFYELRYSSHTRVGTDRFWPSLLSVQSREIYIYQDRINATTTTSALRASPISQE
jgi:hypothetical protein